jgi:hypothetical protein
MEKRYFLCLGLALDLIRVSSTLTYVAVLPNIRAISDGLSPAVCNISTRFVSESFFPSA